MLKTALFLLAVAGVCYSYPLPYWRALPYVGFPYNYWAGFWGYPIYNPAPVYGAKLVFYGDFPGTCEDKPDGLYYVDEKNFAYCFSGQKTIQPCAEGSANPPLDQFNQGGYYGIGDFCSVNLLAQGYGYPPPPPPPPPAPVYDDPKSAQSYQQYQKSIF